MAKNTQPIAKRCRALGISPAVMGYGKKTTNRNPGGQMRKKKSEYATQLNEKQKVKFVYGILENQFHTYYEKASRMPGQTGVNLLVLVERRLDNVVYRLGFAKTRRDARQLVRERVVAVVGHGRHHDDEPVRHQQRHHEDERDVEPREASRARGLRHDLVGRFH